MITLEEILEIHRITIEMDRDNPDDYAPGVRNIGTLYFLIDHAMDLTKSAYYNAAVALCIIGKRHPFINGNKRTATTTAGIILMNEGIEFTINEEEKTTFIKDVATPEKNVSFHMILKWIKENTMTNNETNVI